MIARPTWFAVELREGLRVCPCVHRCDGRAYARGGCDACHGAGVLSIARAA